jgi:hypothetical protein
LIAWLASRTVEQPISALFLGGGIGVATYVGGVLAARRIGSLAP